MVEMEAGAVRWVRTQVKAHRWEGSEGGAAHMQVQDDLSPGEGAEADRPTIPPSTWVSRRQYQEQEEKATRQTKEGHHGPLCLAG